MRRLLLFVGLFTFVACNSPRAALDSGDREPATARGLTAAVLAHLDHVTRYGGSGPDVSAFPTLSSSVEVKASVVDSLFVSVQHGVPDPGCQPDSGYQEVSCEEFDGGSLSVMRTIRAPGRRPAAEGRVMRADGGSVLVEAFAKRAGEDVVGLVRELLADPLIGWTTRAGANAAGDRLPHFHKDSFSRTVDTIS